MIKRGREERNPETYVKTVEKLYNLDDNSAEKTRPEKIAKPEKLICTGCNTGVNKESDLTECACGSRTYCPTCINTGTPIYCFYCNSDKPIRTCSLNCKKKAIQFRNKQAQRDTCFLCKANIYCCHTGYKCGTFTKACCILGCPKMVYAFQGLFICSWCKIKHQTAYKNPFDYCEDHCDYTFRITN